MIKDLLCAGFITSPFGKEGWCNLKPVGNDFNHFKTFKFKKVTLKEGNKSLDLFVEDIQFLSKKVIIKFKGINNLEAALKLKGMGLWIKRKYAQKLKKNEYYVADLVGCNLFFKGEIVGIVKSILETQAHSLLEVEGKEGDIFLIPFRNAYIGKISCLKKIIELKEGLELR